MKNSSSVIIQSPTSFVGSARRIWKRRLIGQVDGRRLSYRPLKGGSARGLT